MLTPSHDTGPKLKHTNKFDSLFVDTSIIPKNFETGLNVNPLPTEYDAEDYLDSDLNKKDIEQKSYFSRLSLQHNLPLPRNAKPKYEMRYSMDPTLVYSKSDSQMNVSNFMSEDNVGSKYIDIVSATASGPSKVCNIGRPLSVPGPPAPISAAMFSPPTISPHLTNGIPLRRPYSHSVSIPDPPTPVKETHTITVDYDPVSGNKLINNYEVLKELGRGCHGKVKLGRDTRNGELVAIKIIHKNTRRRLGSKSAISTQMSKVQREIAILKKCNHPNVVQLKEVIDDPAARKIYMVLEYMDGGEVKFTTSDTDSVALNSESTSCLDKATMRHILRSVVVGLEYLHVQGIIHRDIKPANLLWSSDGQVKISDFGVSFCKRSRSTTPSGSYSLNYRSDSISTSMDDSSTHSESPQLDSYVTSPISDLYIPENLPFSKLIHQVSSEDDDLELAKTAGSPAFFAPELCWAGESDGLLGSSRPSITNMIDIWALGITLYCMAYGHPPFSADSEFELFELIPRQSLVFPNGAEEEDPLLCDLIRGLLTKDQTKRFTLAQVRSHKWVLEDLDDPKQWAIENDPENHNKVEVTEEEVKTAVTLKDRLRRHLRKLSESFMKTFVK